MASRLGLGRIIQWAKDADLEELNYIAYRINAIERERMEKVNLADSHHQAKAKRPRRTKAQIAADHNLPSALDLDAGEKEKSISA